MYTCSTGTVKLYAYNSVIKELSGNGGIAESGLHRLTAEF